MKNQTFEQIFDKLCRVNDRSVIWNNWLDYVININLMQLKNNNTNTNFMNNEKEYYDMMRCWINQLNNKLKTESYYDLIGQLYEENVQSRGKQKDFQQFFTPPQLTELITDLVMNNNTDYNNKFANDCCCGSGRFLLATHMKSQGGVYCIGQDLDETSCKMAVLNFFVHGVRGSIMHMNTLTGEFYKGWRVNKWLYHGIPVPHIEEIYKPVEAYDFFDANKSNNEQNNTVLNKENDNSPSKKTGQTTLM